MRAAKSDGNRRSDLGGWCWLECDAGRSVDLKGCHAGGLLWQPRLPPVKPRLRDSRQSPDDPHGHAQRVRRGLPSTASGGTALMRTILIDLTLDFVNV